MELTTNLQQIAQSYLGNTGYGDVYLRTYAKYTEQQISNNRSYIYAERRLYLSTGTFYSTTGTSSSTTISGVSYSSSDNNQSFNAGETTLGSTEGWYYHSNDGTGSVNITSSFTSAAWGWSGSAGADVTLPTIARASIPTISNPTSDIYVITHNTATIKTNRKSSTFTHTISISIGSFTKQLGTGITDSVDWNTDDDIQSIFTQMISAESSVVPLTITASTYNGTTLIGTATNTIGYKVSASESDNPVVNNFSYEDTNATTLALTGNNQTIIDNYSSVKVSLATSDFTCLYGTSLKYIYINSNRYDYVAGFNTTIANYTNTEDNIRMQAQNNIGMKGSYSKSVTLLRYTTPTQTSISTARTGGINEETTLTMSGKYWNNSFGVTTNSLTATYKYKEHSSSTWISGASALSVTTSGSTFNINQVIKGDIDAGFTTSSQYDIQVLITDSLTTETFTTSVSVGIPALDVYKNNVSLGRAYDTSVGGSVQIYGKEALDYEVVDTW